MDHAITDESWPILMPHLEPKWRHIDVQFLSAIAKPIARQSTRCRVTPNWPLTQGNSRTVYCGPITTVKSSSCSNAASCELVCNEKPRCSSDRPFAAADGLVRMAVKSAAIDVQRASSWRWRESLLRATSDRSATGAAGLADCGLLTDSANGSTDDRLTQIVGGVVKGVSGTSPTSKSRCRASCC